MMDQAFAEYIPGSMAECSTQQNIRIRDEDREILEIIAHVEGDKRILPLIYEGIGRVIEARLQDPEWAANASASLRAYADHCSERAASLESSIS